MRICIKSRIENIQADEVFARFNEELFLALAPKFPPSKLLRFDGCKTGDLVEIEMQLPIIGKQYWTSKITQHSSDSQVRHFFRDEGVKLPFFLSAWQHDHIIEQQGKDVIIVDDIHYKAKFPIPDFLVYPQLYKTFSIRTKIYKSFLGRS
jgi:ligand-binding SRPBCC domain-containing protein